MEGAAALCVVGLPLPLVLLVPAALIEVGALALACERGLYPLNQSRSSLLQQRIANMHAATTAHGSVR